MKKARASSSVQLTTGTGVGSVFVEQAVDSVTNKTRATKTVNTLRRLVIVFSLGYVVFPFQLPPKNARGLDQYRPRIKNPFLFGTFSSRPPPDFPSTNIIVKATSSRTNLDWDKTVKQLILNNIFIDHSVRFLTDLYYSIKSERT